MVVERNPHLTQQAHSCIKEHFSHQDLIPKLAIDATCGNGFDTLFLAEYVTSHVYAFDIQEVALNNTREKLVAKNLDTKVTLIKSGHEDMSEFINASVDTIMFNFGYLPQADKNITTMTNTSIQALHAAMDLLSKDGIMSILCYPGHEEGKKETLAIKDFFNKVTKKFILQEIPANYPNEKSPILFLLKIR